MSCRVVSTHSFENLPRRSNSNARISFLCWHFHNNHAHSGNSDAAGHGNFFGEQYTMVMADRAKDLFHSVGLDLVARPFGIGGATSAPEIAGCAKEIFGTDVDLITWDFAMTDGRWYWRE